MATISPVTTLISSSTELTSDVVTTSSLSDLTTISPEANGTSGVFLTSSLSEVGLIKTVSVEIIVVPSAFVSLRDRLFGPPDFGKSNIKTN